MTTSNTDRPILDLEFIDAQRALDLLDKALTERGEDYVYPPSKQGVDCVYFDEDGQPSCIVGHALSFIGVTKDDLAGVNQSVIDSIVMAGSLPGVTEGAGEVWRTAQAVQDGGGTWGAAVAAARDEAATR